MKGMQKLGIPEDVAMEILVSHSDQEGRTPENRRDSEHDMADTDQPLGLRLQSLGWSTDN